MDWMTVISPAVTLLVGGGMIRVMMAVRGELSELRGEFREWRVSVERRLKKGGL